MNEIDATYLKAVSKLIPLAIQGRIVVIEDARIRISNHK